VISHLNYLIHKYFIKKKKENSVLERSDFYFSRISLITNKKLQVTRIKSGYIHLRLLGEYNMRNILSKPSKQFNINKYRKDSYLLIARVLFKVLLMPQLDRNNYNLNDSTLLAYIYTL